MPPQSEANEAHRFSPYQGITRANDVGVVEFRGATDHEAAERFVAVEFAVVCADSLWGDGRREAAPPAVEDIVRNCRGGASLKHAAG